MSPLKELGIFTAEKLIQFSHATVYSCIASFALIIPMNVSETINAWIQLNIDYISIALFSVGAAHVLGSITHRLYKKDFDWKKNIVGFCIMLSMVVVVALLMEGLAHVTKQQDLIFTYVSMMGRLVVIIYPIRSALKNVKIITNGAFPPDAIIGKLENFNNNLDLNEFRDKNQVDVNEQIYNENQNEEYNNLN